MASVSAITPHLRALQVPAPLCELPAWLIWKYEPRFPGDPKPLKVPMWSDGTKRYGHQGGAHDRSKLTTFALAREAAVRLGASGVGLALLPDLGLTAFDFDNCVDDEGRIPDDIAHFAARTYTEFSPSGRGIRSLCWGNLGNHKSPTKPGQYGFETFSSSGFVTLTGNILPSCDVLGYHNTIAEVDDFATALCARRFAPDQAPLADDFMAGHEPRLGLSVAEIEDLLDHLDPSMGRDTWIKVGMALHHETEGDDTGLEIWNEWSGSAHNYVGREDLETQWDSFTRRAGPGRKQTTMATVKAMVRDAIADEAQRVSKASDVQSAIEGEPVSAHGITTPPGFGGRFPIHSATEMASRPPIDWLVRGVLPRADIVMLYGQSGAGKSFCAIDLAGAIARGAEWRGRVTRKGRVLVLAAEGGGGMGKRLQAYCQYHGLDLDDLDVAVMDASPNLLEADDVTEIARAMRAAGGFDAIIVDTLAQVTPGANENAGEDMGRAIANAQTIRRVTGATVILIHHAGKDQSRGARGWSGVRAAVDAEIEVSRDEVSGARMMRVTKMKDGEDGLRFGFRLDKVTVGMFADGEEVTSCVVVEAEAPIAEPSQDLRRGVKRRGRVETHVVEIVETIEGTDTSMPLAKFVGICADALPPPEPGKRDTRRQVITRAIHNLGREKDGPVRVEGTSVIFFV